MMGRRFNSFGRNVFLGLAASAIVGAAIAVAPMISAEPQPDTAKSYTYSHVITASRASGFEETSVETWRGDDGSGRARATGRRNDDRKLPPGSFPEATVHDLALSSLPASDDALSATLEEWVEGQPKWVGNTDADATRAYKVWDFLESSVGAPSVPPAVRAALVRALERVPGATVTGPTTDGAGRQGIGVSFSYDNGARFTDTVIVDSARTTVLGITMEVADSGGTDDPNYALGRFSYTVFVESGTTSSTTSTP